MPLRRVRPGFVAGRLAVPRRAAILDAAREHFATTSYPDASVPVIAAASGSSQSLVFHYFSSKAGLYAAVVEDSLRSLIDACETQRTTLLALIEADAAGFLPLQKAYAIPRTDPDRAAKLAAAAQTATGSPR